MGIFALCLSYQVTEMVFVPTFVAEDLMPVASIVLKQSSKTFLECLFYCTIKTQPEH